MERKTIEARQKFWRRWATYFVREAAEQILMDKEWKPAYNMACKANNQFQIYWIQL